MAAPDAPRPPAAERATPRRHWSEDAAFAAWFAAWERAHPSSVYTIGTMHAAWLAARPAPPITTAERAALDRLEAHSHANSVIDGPAFMADLRVALALARRAGAAATPDVESTPHVDPPPVVSDSKLQESAATP